MKLYWARSPKTANARWQIRPDYGQGISPDQLDSRLKYDRIYRGEQHSPWFALVDRESFEKLLAENVELKFQLKGKK